MERNLEIMEWRRVYKVLWNRERGVSRFKKGRYKESSDRAVNEEENEPVSEMDRRRAKDGGGK